MTIGMPHVDRQSSLKRKGRLLTALLIGLGVQNSLRGY